MTFWHSSRHLGRAAPGGAEDADRPGRRTSRPCATGWSAATHRRTRSSPDEVITRSDPAATTAPARRRVRAGAAPVPGRAISPTRSIGSARPTASPRQLDLQAAGLVAGGSIPGTDRRLRLEWLTEVESSAPRTITRSSSCRAPTTNRRDSVPRRHNQPNRRTIRGRRAGDPQWPLCRRGESPQQCGVAHSASPSANPVGYPVGRVRLDAVRDLASSSDPVAGIA